MNSRAHWLSALVAVTHLLIGLSGLFNIGPTFLPPSWQVIYLVLPNSLDWLYPALWVVAGVLSLLGIRSLRAMRAGFYLSSALFLIWGSAGIPAMIMGIGGNLQGISANLYTSGLAWLVTYYATMGQRGNEINTELVKLDEKVHQATTHGPD